MANRAVLCAATLRGSPHSSSAGCAGSGQPVRLGGCSGLQVLQGVAGVGKDAWQLSVSHPAGLQQGQAGI